MKRVLLAAMLLGGLMASAQNPAPAKPVQPAQANQVTASLTVEQLKERLTQLQQGEKQAEDMAQQAQANVHAFQGAIQETQRWIDTLSMIQGGKAVLEPPKK